MSQEILTNLGTISRELTQAVEDLATMEQTAAASEGAFKVAAAKAFLVAEGAVQARQAQADIATEQQRLDYRTSEAMVRVQRERIRALHARIDVGRTLASTERKLSGVAS